ncbi:MAG: DUF3418 domain-containing protein, partial [Proteobacteria bacterium]|nr:DUF3418 domain-containing protein [Pseudomonadota bacterium]
KELKEMQQCTMDMKALIIRIERAYVDPAKDMIKAEQLKPHLHNLQILRQREKDLSAECLHELKKYQEMINQFRITLFAPEIQGGVQVSSKKLSGQWQETCKYC